MAKKIGMCCACGAQLPLSKTLLYDRCEYCPRCAEMLGIEAEDEDEEDDETMEALGEEEFEEADNGR